MAELLETEPDLPLVHTRTYDVRAYRAGPDEMLVRGVIRDEKPPGQITPDDPDPLTIHHMIVEFRVRYPSMEITSAEVDFKEHPNPQCPAIAAHYHELVGLSVARGFTHKVRELFGGPRGCTHTTALLQAMAPVAVQAGMGLGIPRGIDPQTDFNDQVFVEIRRAHAERNRDTCHAWATDSELSVKALRGDPMPIPLTLRRRRAELGLPVDSPAE